MKTPKKKIVVLRNEAGLLLLTVQLKLIHEEADALAKAAESLEEYHLPAVLRQTSEDFRKVLLELLELKKGGVLV